MERAPEPLAVLHVDGLVEAEGVAELGQRLVGGHGAEQGARHVAGDQLHGEEDHHRDAEQDGDQAEQPLEDVDDHAGMITRAAPASSVRGARAAARSTRRPAREARLEELVGRAASVRGVGRIGSGLRLRSVFTASVLSGARCRSRAVRSRARPRAGSRRQRPVIVTSSPRSVKRRSRCPFLPARRREGGGLLLAVHDGQVERVVERLPGRIRRAGRSGKSGIRTSPAERTHASSREDDTTSSGHGDHRSPESPLARSASALLPRLKARHAAGPANYSPWHESATGAPGKSLPDSCRAPVARKCPAPAQLDPDPEEEIHAEATDVDEVIEYGRRSGFDLPRRRRG